MLEEKSESGDVALGMKPEERPNLQDYKDRINEYQYLSRLQQGIF
jgi:hypothetical protein